MALKKEPCKNHPDRMTSRHCYYCKAPICHACQLHFEHHLFCSRACYYRWKVTQFKERFHKLPHKDFYLSLILFLMVIVSLVVYFDHRIDRLAEQQSLKTNHHSLDSLWFDLDTTVSRLNGRISFDLRAPVNTVIALWHNGQPIVTQGPASSRKRAFENLPLSIGENRFVLWEYGSNGRAVLIDSFNVHFQSARLRFMAQPLYRVGIRAKYLALTFDAGSTDRGSLNILRILHEKGLHCTLFVTGQFIRHYPDIVKKIVSDGHQIGNHTFSHPHLTTYAQNGRQTTRPQVTRSFIFNQLLRTDSVFNDLTGKHLAPFWRAPYGEFNKQILRWAAEAGYKHIGWSRHCDALDWVADSTASLYRTGNEILNHFLHLEETSGLQGRIILMHLGTERRHDFPYQILPALIDSLRHRGYQFLTVGQLMSEKSREQWVRK